MILILNAKDRNWIVKALALLSDEYRQISECNISETLRRGFEEDASDISSLAGRAAGLLEYPDAQTVKEAVLRFMRVGQKIPAIKYVRDNRPGLGLREAKDLVEKIEADNPLIDGFGV